MWRMNCIERHIKEKRLIFRLRFDEFRCLASEQVRRVTLLLQRFAVAILILFSIAIMLEEIDGTEKVSVKMVEAAFIGPIRFVKTAKVPFATNRGGISNLTQGLRQHPFLQRQSICCPRPNHA